MFGERNDDAICILDMAFELFCQKIKPVKQRAYKHFQTEERLLKLGGESLRERGVTKRSEGKKTELAFAESLGLKGDPFEALLSIHKFSEESLIQLINCSVHS